jgi:hypothetical protein
MCTVTYGSLTLCYTEKATKRILRNKHLQHIKPTIFKEKPHGNENDIIKKWFTYMKEYKLIKIRTKIKTSNIKGSELLVQLRFIFYRNVLSLSLLSFMAASNVISNNSRYY